MWRGASKGPAETASAAVPLAQQLREITVRTRQLLPAESLAPLDRAVEELRASGLAERVLPVGAPAPAFELSDQNGNRVRSADLVARGRLIVNFFRGRWCPYCVTELEAWQAWLPEVEAAGAGLVAISPQRALHTEFTASQHRITYPVLSDAGNKVARQFGLVYRVPEFLEQHYRRVFIHLPKVNGDESWELPLAATYLLERDGQVLSAFASADFRQRAEPSQVMSAVLASC